MAKAKDDLEAVRAVTAALEGFEPSEQDRIIRWSREKLGLTDAGEESPPTRTLPPVLTGASVLAQGSEVQRRPDIQSFVTAKNPRTDSQFAATVAYYYRFEASEGERKDVITKDDLQEACRKVGRERFNKPIATLFNTFKAGLLDKGAEKGSFKINSVGENLVAMALPGGELSSAPRIRKQKKNRQGEQSKQRRAR